MHDGTFLGYGPTGTKISYGGICIFKLNDDLKISEYCCYSSALEVISRQTGSSPEVKNASLKDDSKIFEKLRSIGKATLTGREVHILVLWGCFYTAKDSALRLGISHRTVEDYRSSILNKTELPDAKCLFELLRSEGKMSLIHYLEGSRLEYLVPIRYRKHHL